MTTTSIVVNQSFLQQGLVNFLPNPTLLSSAEFQNFGATFTS
jgi:hypothetical protein